MSVSGTERDSELRTHVAYCEACAMYTEERHTAESAVELCETHNKNRGGCEAEPIPVCWVCHDRATRRNQKPPYEYICEEHALSIDAVPLEEWGDSA